MRYPAAEKLEIIRLVEQSVALGAAHAAPARYPAFHFLPLVRALFGARRRGPGRWPVGAAPRLEQNPPAGG